jgi:hypothetical protein
MTRFPAVQSLLRREGAAEQAGASEALGRLTNNEGREGGVPEWQRRSLLMCRKHWFHLPKAERALIIASYVLAAPDQRGAGE